MSYIVATNTQLPVGRLSIGLLTLIVLVNEELLTGTHFVENSIFFTLSLANEKIICPYFLSILHNFRFLRATVLPHTSLTKGSKMTFFGDSTLYGGFWENKFFSVIGAPANKFLFAGGAPAYNFFIIFVTNHVVVYIMIDKYNLQRPAITIMKTDKQ